MICFSPSVWSACDLSSRGIRGTVQMDCQQSCPHPRQKGGISDMLCGGHGQLSSVSARDGLSTNLSANLRSLSTRAKSPACCALARWNCGPSLPSKMHIVTLASIKYHAEYSPTVMQSGLAHGTPVSLYLCHLLLEVTAKHSGGHQAASNPI